MESRATLASLSGSRISSVQVSSEKPDLPSFLHFATSLHPASQTETIRRQLLFAPGDSVDTLLVGETMRRLRRTRLFSDAVLVAQRCAGSGNTTLLVRTRDSWTLQPTARLRTPSSLSLGVEERNLFGTGRTVAVTSEMSSRGTGAGVTFVDPWLLGRDVMGSFRLAKLGDTHTLRASLRNHEYSVFDQWRVEANLARFSFGDTASTERSLHTIAAMFLIGHRVGAPSPTSVTMLLTGVEFDSAAAISATNRLPANAPAGMQHVRSFLGADVGVLQRTAAYDTASWIVPGRGFLDVPVGWETETVVGGGYERDARSPALKLDAWAGRVLVPARGRIVTLDGWMSGYAGRGVDANHIARLSGGWYQEAAGGMWSTRLTAERLFQVDPDQRALSLLPLTDYTAPAVRPYAVRGGRSLAGSVERTFHLRQVGATSVLDAGPFVAASYRWQVDSVPSGQLRAGVVGTRVRLLSANGAISSVRVDVGYPVLLSSALRRRPFAVLTIGSIFDVIRQRDGRRQY